MEYHKVDPKLVQVLGDYKNFGRTILKRHMKTLGITSTDEGQKPPRISVFLGCEQNENFIDFKKENVIVNQTKGKIRTAFLPIEKVSELSDDARVRNIVSSRYLRLLMDVAPQKVNLTNFRNNTKLSGKETIIGVIDSGIDPQHSAFSGRIHSIWDQIISGPGVAEGGYGMELTDQLLSVSRDTNGHGSHVAGIAAGKDVTYGGVAPEAELVIVKTDMSDTRISDGIRYIFRVAEEQGKPAVINLSLGGHFGPHDGTDGLSEIIDEESGPGRIVCCAAGNEGNDDIHAQTILKDDQVKNIRFRIPPPTIEDLVNFTALNGWYSGDDKISISIRSPNGFTTPYQDIISLGSPSAGYSSPDGSVQMQTPGPDPVNGDHQFWIEISPSAGQSFPKPGTWFLRLKGQSIKEGVVDVWTLDNGERLDVIFTGQSVSDTMKVGSPGSAKQAVTVASFTTKVQWKDASNKQRHVGFELDDISDFSSEGPLRNGIEKPDVAAPGAMIAAALSSDSEANPAYVISSDYRIMMGTSMAAPFMTGIIALMLERKQDLTPDEVKAILKTNSSIPGKPQGSFDIKWGYGIIDASNL
jgi:subtilisin family serine protease